MVTTTVTTTVKFDACGITIRKTRMIKKCDTKYDVALSSDSLANCFDTNWGGETLMINGRFQEGKLGNKANFFRWFSIAQANSRKTYYDLKYYIKNFYIFRFAQVKWSGSNCAKHPKGRSGNWNLTL